MWSCVGVADWWRCNTVHYNVVCRCQNSLLPGVKRHPFLWALLYSTFETRILLKIRGVGPLNGRKMTPRAAADPTWDGLHVSRSRVCWRPSSGQSEAVHVFITGQRPPVANFLSCSSAQNYAPAECLHQLATCGRYCNVSCKGACTRPMSALDEVEAVASARLDMPPSCPSSWRSSTRYRCASM
jgi:hypothetical protein